MRFGFEASIVMLQACHAFDVMWMGSKLEEWIGIRHQWLQFLLLFNKVFEPFSHMFVLIYNAYMCELYLIPFTYIQQIFFFDQLFFFYCVYKYFSSVLSTGRSDRIDTREMRGKRNYKQVFLSSHIIYFLQEKTKTL